MGSEVVTIPRMTRVFKDTKANLDALTGLREEDLGYATDELVLYRYSGSAWEAITQQSSIASGSYTGNDTANRAIPHGLLGTPKMVMIKRSDDVRWYRMFGTQAMIGFLLSSPSMGQYAVTIPDATNFYVGNATSYDASANQNAQTYYWVAFG